ncbi:MAG: hypothetical protein LDL37_08640 [Asticcacaulis sp.]|uniref:hypothetical protein n=1 Tax=Asticcacaulis sp. TaxID=1872648 RepID=UPI0025C08ED8|nr:hypothetical protein [Asticcacaulis sp.]MCA1935506.1 hypothetical protein [Asticcacaulis sp.]
MDVHSENKAELRAMLAERRAALRDYADTVLGHVTALSKPETALEAERTARAVMAADSMLCQLFAPPPEPKSLKAAARTLASDDAEEAKPQRYGLRSYTIDEEAAQKLALERAEAELNRQGHYETHRGEMFDKIVTIAKGMHLALWRDEGYVEADVTKLMNLWGEYYKRIIEETGQPPDVELRRHPAIFAPDYHREHLERLEKGERAVPG